jgi:TonB family protein
MKTILSMALVLIFSCSDNPEQASQSSELPFEEVKFGTLESSVAPDSFAKFPGGNEGIMNYFSSNIKRSDSTVHGRIVVSFVVDMEGNVREIKIRKGINESFDAEVMRVIKSMPKWKPAIKDGVPISIEYLQPFRF